MRSYVAKIGLFDRSKNEHSIELQPGVNIITGRSSTGKSALIEIFDYCFGNTEETIPDGVITDSAELYFIILSIKKAFLVLARRPDISKKVFFKYDLKFDSNLSIKRDYFEDDYFIPLQDFKSTLGNFFGLDISDTDENLEDRKYRKNNAKKGRPSIRNMTSYFLQHQNMIANKHSLFYRFDEKEKREQTIDQLKIFCGFVDQEYFIKKQELNDLKVALDKEKRKAISHREQKEILELKLEEVLNEYKYVVGKPLFNAYTSNIIISPREYLDKLTDYEIEPDFSSEEYSIRLNDLNKKKNIELGIRRERVIRLNQINSTIEYAKEYSNTIDNIKPLEDIRKIKTECPFCHSETSTLLNEANKLSNAINWLNDELHKTPLLLDSLQPERRKIEKEISDSNNEINELNRQINDILKINNDLKRNKSLEEQGYKIVLQVENILQEVLEINNLNVDQNINTIERKLKLLNVDINASYNPDSKLKNAQNYINTQMNSLGRNLEFEKTYNPINLRFDINTFELYHLKEDGKQVFLRSMGSGANWLYSHICLFTSLLRYFCTLKDSCKIPSILFLDQPSQVYFPTNIDNNTETFDAKSLKKLENKDNVDDDIKAVTNLFDRLVEFCISTKEETEIEPQIIITDHADNLHLKYANFEDLVNGRRWRSKDSGLVKLTNIQSTT